MGKRRKMTTIRIDAEILEKAQKYGLNISKSCEYALRKMIEAIEKVDFQNTPKEGIGNVVSDERARWDLNPRSPAPKAGALIHTWPRAPLPPSGT